MGTRSSIGFIKNDVRRSTYSQFDGYPDSAGQEVVDIINHIKEQPDGLKRLEERLVGLERVSNETQRPTPEQVKRYWKFGNMSVSERSEHDWYCLLRNLQNGLWIHAAFNGDLDHLFEDDKTNEDYNYFLDFDTMMFQVYNWDDLIGYFPLDNIPSDWRNKLKGSH